MIQPTEADLGRKVVHRERGDFPGKKVEEGEGPTGCGSNALD
jgi:hypothetical protein